MLDTLDRGPASWPASSTTLDALSVVPSTSRRFSAGSEIASAGDQSDQTLRLTHGLAMRFGQMRNGGSQITQLSVPGDFIDLDAFILTAVDQPVCALTDCTAVAYHHDDLRRALRSDSGLAEALWRESARIAAVQTRWLTTMGGLDASSRLAHLLCELSLRLEASGNGDGIAFRLPLTQSTLGQILGVTTVHVNRTLMDLRRLGYVDWSGAAVVILNRPALAKLGQFEVGYLHLPVEVPLGTPDRAYG